MKTLVIVEHNNDSIKQTTYSTVTAASKISEEVFALILGFAYFYASLTINPIDIASNLKKGGVAIPGVRPGSATAKYLSGVQNRLTLLGGLFLGSVAIIPAAVERATNVQTFQGLGATSLLILVGVAIDTAKQVQTYVISQRYEGLVRQ